MISAVLDATPDVAAANDNADLNAAVHALLYHIGHLTDDFKIQTAFGIASQCLAADF
jgi:hypothetical protein